MYVLSIDQSSNCSGVSLWWYDDLVATCTLNSKSPKDTLGRRLAEQCRQLEGFLDYHLADGDEIDTVIFEGVKSKIVLIVVGAYCTVPQLQHCKVTERHSFIYSMSWKRYAQKLNATGKLGDIKGVKALREIGFDVDKYQITSDDIADSVLIYKTWESKQK